MRDEQDQGAANQRARAILKWDRENGYATSFAEKRALLKMCSNAECIFWLSLQHWELPEERTPQ